MNYQSYAVTHAGNKRNSNQDAYYQYDAHGLWAVADGMGGHHAGDIASQSIIQSLDELSQAGKENTNILTLTSVLEDVNERLFKNNMANNCMVGSTVAIAFAQENQCTCLWVGDSRVYLSRHNQLTQISNDHVNAEHQHMITRAIGVAEKLYFDYASFVLEPYDRLLLCSDGLYNEVAPEEIQAVLQYSSPEQGVQELLNLCLSRKGRDNISIIIVEVSE